MYVVARPEELEEITDYLNTHLAVIERKFDLQIAVRGLTRSELDTVANTTLKTRGNLVLIAGVPPAGLTARSRYVARQPKPVAHGTHDASKLVAFRDKDRDFVRVLLREDLIQPQTLRLRLSQLPKHPQLTPQLRDAIAQWLRGVLGDIGARG